MAIVIQDEYFTRELIEEIQPLLDLHWEEVERYEDIKMDVDWPMYRVLQDQGIFRFYTIRVDGLLAGYIGYLVSPSLHYKGNQWALCDLVYVKPEYRGKMFASKLLRYAEKELKEMNVLNIGQGVKIHHDYGKILERQGYHLEEKYFSKRIQ